MPTRDRPIPARLRSFLTRSAAVLAVAAAGLCAPYSARAEGERIDFAEAAVGRFVVVRTEGGGEFQGVLIAAAPDRLELVDGEGRIVSVHRPAVVSLTAYDRTRYFRDAAESRLIVMPTAFPMEAGELHVTSQEIIAVTLSWGATAHLSAWGGISLPGALGNVRLAYESAAAGAVSAGAFAGASWAEPQTSAVMPYVIYSAGRPDRNLSAALAAPFAFPASGDPHLSGLLAAVGCKSPLSRTAALVLESWFFFGSGGGGWRSFDLTALPAGVFRIAGGRFSWDIGAVVPVRLDDTEGEFRLGGIMDGPVIPWPLLSAVYRLR